EDREPGRWQTVHLRLKGAQQLKEQTDMKRRINLIRCTFSVAMVVLLAIGMTSLTTRPVDSSGDAAGTAPSTSSRVANAVGGPQFSPAGTGIPAIDNVFEIDGDATDPIPPPGNLPDDWNDLNPAGPDGPIGSVTTGPAGNALIATYIVDT